MGLNLQQALGVHPAALSLRGERAQLLAANLANESTPGYQARDIDFDACLQRLSAQLSAQMRPSAPRALYRVPNRAALDGNTVELGDEQARFAQNATDFQSSLAFVNMKLKGLAAAIRGEA